MQTRIGILLMFIFLIIRTHMLLRYQDLCNKTMLLLENVSLLKGYHKNSPYQLVR